MTEDLLQDLILYRKSHEKSVSSSARSLLTLFREICPSLLLKKDRGRPIDPKARPKAYGEVSVATNVLGVELLEDDDDGGSDDATENGFISDDEEEDVDDGKNDENVELVEDDNSSEDAVGGTSESDFDSSGDGDVESNNDGIGSETNSMQEDEDDDAHYSSDNTDSVHEQSSEEADENEKASSSQEGTTEEIIKDSTNVERKSKGGKRKFSDFEDQLNAANRSLRALKKLAGSRMGEASGTKEDGILSNDDFRRIKELKVAKKEARIALTQHGFKIPSSEQLSTKRVDATKLEANIRKKLSKEERLALIRAGREEKGKYQARSAIKKKKTGGLSNRQKEHKKVMPFAAKKAKAAKSRQEKKRKQQRSGKQFRGRKAWK